MRAQGCIINDIADRHFDGHVSRTRERVLASGAVSLKEALLLFGVMTLVAFGLVLMTNELTVLYAIPALGLASLYPFTKRFLRGPQFVLGLAFSWSIPMVYAATNTPLSIETLVLFSLSVIWPIIYDTLYALVDRDDDLKLGIHSTAIWFGDTVHGVLLIGQLIFFGLLVMLGSFLPNPIGYYAGLLLVGLLVVHQCRLMYRRDTTSAFDAFLFSQWIGGAIFLALFWGNFS